MSSQVLANMTWTPRARQSTQKLMRLKSLSNIKTTRYRTSSKTTTLLWWRLLNRFSSVKLWDQRVCPGRLNRSEMRIFCQKKNYESFLLQLIRWQICFCRWLRTSGFLRWTGGDSSKGFPPDFAGKTLQGFHQKQCKDVHLHWGKRLLHKRQVRLSIDFHSKRLNTISLKRWTFVLHSRSSVCCRSCELWRRMRIDNAVCKLKDNFLPVVDRGSERRRNVLPEMTKLRK